MNRDDLPPVPDSDNSPQVCFPTGRHRNFEHIITCGCDQHTGVCEECNNIVTVTTSEVDLGHARDCEQRDNSRLDTGRN